MFNNDKKSMNEMLFSMFHLRNKSHLSNSKAMQLAFRSNWMCKTGYGNFLTGEELSKQEKFKIERDQAVQELVLGKNLLESLESVLREFHEKGDDTSSVESESSIVIKASDVSGIKPESVKLLIASAMGIDPKSFNPPE